MRGVGRGVLNHEWSRMVTNEWWLAGEEWGGGVLNHEWTRMDTNEWWLDGEEWRGVF
jgi:hypothetical protein